MANANTTNNNMATTNTNVMGANAGNLNGNANPVKQTAAATKDSLQEERELQDMLDRLDQAHLQAGPNPQPLLLSRLLTLECSFARFA
jgi:hypothetical protein